jgi:uncharacterized membrane protein YqjE
MTTSHHDPSSGTDGMRSEPTGELVKQLTEDMRTLVRKEIELGRAELGEKGKRAGVGAGMLSGAAVVGVLALAALTTCLIAALDTAMPLWVAALIVAVVYGAIAGVMALTGKNKVQEAAPPVPAETVDSVKEDVQWLKNQR